MRGRRVGGGVAVIEVTVGEVKMKEAIFNFQRTNR